MIFLLDVFYQDEHVLAPFCKVVEGIEHVIDHFNLIFRIPFEFLQELGFVIFDVDFEIEHTFEPIPVYGIIGVGRRNGISFPCPWETHSAEIVMVDGEPAVMAGISAFLNFNGNKQMRPFSKILFCDLKQSIYTGYTFQIQSTQNIGSINLSRHCICGRSSLAFEDQ